MIRADLRHLYHVLHTTINVENFVLVGLLVIHGVPQRGMLADEQFQIDRVIGDCWVTMMRMGVTSTLHGARFKGHAWPAEKHDIFSFLSSCEDMRDRAAWAEQPPEPYEVPRPFQHMRVLALPDRDYDDDDDDDDEGEDDEEEELSFLQSLD